MKMLRIDSKTRLYYKKRLGRAFLTNKSRFFFVIIGIFFLFLWIIHADFRAAILAPPQIDHYRQTVNQLVKTEIAPCRFGYLPGVPLSSLLHNSCESPVTPVFLPERGKAMLRHPALLWSFPGSGNSFVRLVLEQATGYLTGSVYHKDPIMLNVFKGEDHCDTNVIAVKSHRMVTERCRHVEGSRHIIVLLRHPFNAFWSEFSRKQAPNSSLNKHTALIERVSFNTSFFEEVMVSMASQWATHHSWRFQTAKEGAQLHVIRYEDLLDPPKTAATVAGLLNFLEVCNPSPILVAKCSLAHASHPSLHRVHSSHSLSLEEVLTPSLQMRIWNVLGPLASQWGYTQHNWRR